MAADSTANKNTFQTHLSNLHGKHTSYKKSADIFNPGDAAEGFYLVLNGKVELTHQDDPDHVFVKEINKNEFFGLDDFIKKIKRTNKAVAKEDTEIIKITLSAFNKNHEEIKKETSNVFLNQDATSVTNISALQNLVAVSDIDSIKLVAFYGQRANLNNAMFFKNLLLELIEKGADKLIIDLSACKIIDSTFLGSLIAVLKRVSLLGGRLCLICCADICSWLFVMTKMDEVFDIFQSLDEAVNSFKR